MKTNYKIFKEMDKNYVEKLSLETKLSYILTDIIFNSVKSNLKTQLRIV